MLRDKAPSHTLPTPLAPSVSCFGVGPWLQVSPPTRQGCPPCHSGHASHSPKTFRVEVKERCFLQSIKIIIHLVLCDFTQPLDDKFSLLSFFFLARTNLEPPPDVCAREPTAEEGRRLIKRSDFTFINPRRGLRLKEATVEKKEQRDLRNLRRLHKDSARFNSCGSSPKRKIWSPILEELGLTLSPKTPVSILPPICHRLVGL